MPIGDHFALHIDISIGKGAGVQIVAGILLQQAVGGGAVFEDDGLAIHKTAGVILAIIADGADLQRQGDGDRPFGVHIILLLVKFPILPVVVDCGGQAIGIVGEIKHLLKTALVQICEDVFIDTVDGHFVVFICHIVIFPSG